MLPRETALSDKDRADLAPVAEAISRAERRAMEAERETVDRYVATHLASRVGEVFDTRVTGVQSFGFFATIVGLGGDGLVPVRSLGREYFRYDEAAQTLTGKDSGTGFAPGQRLKLRLAEANPLTGGMRFELPDTDAEDDERPSPRSKPPARTAGEHPASGAAAVDARLGSASGQRVDRRVGKPRGHDVERAGQRSRPRR